jgi:hypothetical protein
MGVLLIADLNQNETPYKFRTVQKTGDLIMGVLLIAL